MSANAFEGFQIKLLNLHWQMLRKSENFILLYFFCNAQNLFSVFLLLFLQMQTYFMWIISPIFTCQKVFISFY